MSSRNNRLKYPILFHRKRSEMAKGRLFFYKPRPYRRRKRGAF